MTEGDHRRTPGHCIVYFTAEFKIVFIGNWQFMCLMLINES